MRTSLHMVVLIAVAQTWAMPANAVSISEVAWMGSQSSANHEWIELYNPGGAISVEGWTLRDGMNLIISLSGTVPANSYVVLERNRSDGGSVVGAPFLQYAGALVNTGATLTLQNEAGTIVDQVVGGENWQNIGGDNTTKETAQYTSAGWITAAPTPGQSNATAASVTQATITPSTGTVGSTILAAAETVQRKSYAHLPWELSLGIEASRTVQVNQSVEFRSSASGLGPTHLASLMYTWNFGDTVVSHGATSSHLYQYPGTYIVTLHAEFAGRSAVAEQVITVLPVTMSLARLESGVVQIYNDSAYDIDVSGFRLVGADRIIIFPPRSYLRERSALTLPYDRVGTGTLTLYDAKRVLLATTNNGSGNAIESQKAESTIMPLVSSQSPPIANLAPVSALTVNNPQFRFATSENEVQWAENELSYEDVDVSPIAIASENEVALVTQTDQRTGPHWSYGAFFLLLAFVIVIVLIRPASTKQVSQ